MYKRQGSHVPCYEYLGSYRNTWKSTGGAEYPTCPTWAAIGIPLCHSTLSVSMSLLTRYVQWPIGGLGYLPWVILGTCPGLYVLVHVLGYMSCQFFSQKVRTAYATHVKSYVVVHSAHDFQPMLWSIQPKNTICYACKGHHRMKIPYSISRVLVKSPFSWMSSELPTHAIAIRSSFLLAAANRGFSLLREQLFVWLGFWRRRSS